MRNSLIFVTSWSRFLFGIQVGHPYLAAIFTEGGQVDVILFITMGGSQLHTNKVIIWMSEAVLHIGLGGCFLLSLTACQVDAPSTTTPEVESLRVSPTWTASHTQVPSNAPIEAPQISPIASATESPVQLRVPTATSTPAQDFYEPAGCWQPPDDYTRLIINDQSLNTRTYNMLQQAALLYDGEIDVAGEAIIRGSYRNDTLESIDPHLGGGVVDISVTRPKTDKVLYSEVEPLIRALRTVGFAAWLRDSDESGSGSGVYIHAIAIGDIDLSPADQEQLTGSGGYLRGNASQLIISGNSGHDQHGGPVICRWMVDAGYADSPASTPIPTPEIPWQERLRLAALAYEAPYPEDAEEIARSLNFLDGKTESAENICGPLAAAILRDAGLLPTQPGPVQDLKSYWQARPIDNGRPWSLFSERDYEVFHFDTPLAEFDFKAWPLQPADFLYTYAKGSGFEHMFVVTEVDAEGRAYTVTNQYQSWGNPIWGSMLILRYLLYDPQSPGDGIIYNEWSNSRLGQTGHNGFDVLRKRGLDAGNQYAYTVRPGDTLPELAARFGTTIENLEEANPGLDLANLQVNQPLTIPIPPYTQGSSESVQERLP